MDRCRNIVSEEEDRKLEEQHIMNALERCGYLRWTFMKVKKQMNNNKEKTKRREKHERSKGLVVTPYVKGISEPLERIYRKHNISTAMRPHMTLRKILVHPKDKREKEEQSGVVYSIPCIDCDQVYIGETGRQFGVRKKEHLDEAKEVAQVPFTRNQRKMSVAEQKKSAVSDHVGQSNHTIDWEGARILDKEDNKWPRKIREAIQIRKHRGRAMNRDEGQYNLPAVYNPILRQSELVRAGESKKVYLSV